jgi:hypothetical protein
MGSSTRQFGIIRPYIIIWCPKHSKYLQQKLISHKISTM